MSDEVDYSRFYYKWDRGTVEQGNRRPPTHPLRKENEAVTEHRVEVDEVATKKEKKKRKGGKKFFPVLIVLLLCFGLVFLCADFFGKGFLTDAIGKAFSGETYEYHFVASPASSRYVAYADSLSVKQKGGAGYIIGGEENWVAYAVYTDRTVASSVSLKNRSTEVYTIKFSTKDDLAKQVDMLTQELEKSISAWEQGTLTEVELETLIRNEKETFGLLKSNYADNKLSLCELVIEGLENFSPSATEKIANLSELRYYLCMVVYSAYTVFK